MSIIQSFNKLESVSDDLIKTIREHGWIHIYRKEIQDQLTKGLTLNADNPFNMDKEEGALSVLDSTLEHLMHKTEGDVADPLELSIAPDDEDLAERKIKTIKTVFVYLELVKQRIIKFHDRRMSH